MHQIILVDGIKLIIAKLNDANADTLRQMIDRFRQQYPTQAVAVLGSNKDGRPTIIAAITDDLLLHGLNAVELVRFVAAPLGGGGGGKPNLAQAGGKDASKLDDALKTVENWLKKQLHP
jgi:alanyl-tRNA synthetase